MKSHFVCALIWRMNQILGELEFLVIDVRSRDPRTGFWSRVQTKFPGGTNRANLAPRESVTMTLQREVLEETRLAILPQNAKQVWKAGVSANHTKYGFLVSFLDCRGELRTGSLIDNEDEMSEPYWVATSILGRVLFEKHQAPFLAACRELGVL